MRKIVTLLLCLCLTGCTAPAPAPADASADLTVDEIAQAVLERQSDGADYIALAVEDLDNHITMAWNLTEPWESAAVYTVGGMDAREIGVVLLGEGADDKTAVEALDAYRQRRLADFYGYAPQEADLVDGALIKGQGRYLVYLACRDMEAAQLALSDVLSGDWTAAETPAPTATSETVPAMEVVSAPPSADSTAPPEGTDTPEVTDTPQPAPTLDISDFPPFNPPNEADMTLYDTSAIRAAWATGDETALTEKDAATLARCREVLGKVLTEGMSDFEKELALHDWLVEWGSYDQSANATPDHSGQPDNNNPYGMLVGGYGICLGYATTFQLLMDLAGVECITVVGASFRSTGDHAWNQVRLSGEWYCVDPTWDDPTIHFTGPPPAAEWLVEMAHCYFNVTSDEMRDSNHQWDYANVPEATATAYRWDGVSPLPEE